MRLAMPPRPWFFVLAAGLLGGLLPLMVEPARGGEPTADGGSVRDPAAGASGSAIDALWKSPVVGGRRRESSWNRSGENRDCFTLKPGGRVTLFDHRGGSGTIRRVWFTLGHGDQGYLQTTKLRFRFDGQTTVDDVPVGMLAATGPWRVNDVVSPVVNVMRSRLPKGNTSGTGQGSFNFLWPMPFAKEAAIDVVNESKAEMTIHYYVDYQLHPVDRPLWFHAAYRREHFTTPAEKTSLEKTPVDRAARKKPIGEDDYLFADIRQTEGRYVGTVLAVESHPDRVGKWYEGDDRFVLDGKTLLHGTGTEDYFGMAWGVYRVYAGFDHGATHVEQKLTDKDRRYDGRFAVYRWHLADPIEFKTSLRASIEAGHGNECAQHYESVAFWYGRPSEDGRR